MPAKWRGSLRQCGSGSRRARASRSTSGGLWPWRRGAMPQISYSRSLPTELCPLADRAVTSKRQIDGWLACLIACRSGSLVTSSSRGSLVMRSCGSVVASARRYVTTRPACSAAGRPTTSALAHRIARRFALCNGAAPPYSLRLVRVCAAPSAIRYIASSRRAPALAVRATARWVGRGITTARSVDFSTILWPRVLAGPETRLESGGGSGRAGVPERGVCRVVPCAVRQARRGAS